MTTEHDFIINGKNEGRMSWPHSINIHMTKKQALDLIVNISKQLKCLDNEGIVIHSALGKLVKHEGGLND
jgi:hypothetical protein